MTINISLSIVVALDSLYTRLAILGADINISPTADKTIELLALVTAYDSTLHQLSRKLRIKYFLLCSS